MLATKCTIHLWWTTRELPLKSPVLRLPSLHLTVTVVVMMECYDLVRSAGKSLTDALGNKLYTYRESRIGRGR